MNVAVAPARKRVLIVSGEPVTLIRFRKPLILELRRRNYDVICASSPTTPEIRGAVEALGTTYEEIPLSRAGLNPFADAWTLIRLLALMRRTKPDVVMTYNIKPNVYGILAAAIARVPRRVAMVEGLGYAFTEGREFKRRVARAVSSLLYWIPTRLVHALIVLNQDDRAFFAARYMRGREERLHVIPGIGVDLEEFKPEPLPEGPTTFVMIARLLRDKGVYEYVEAAREVRKAHPEVRFLLVGGIDANPNSVDPKDLEKWQRDGTIEYAGEVGDVRPWLRRSHVLVLPTRYREGMPRTVMEAMAMGRPCVVSDAPGCADAVEHERSGLVIPQTEPRSLSIALGSLASNEGLIRLLSKGALAQSTVFSAKEISLRMSFVLEGLDWRDADPVAA